jgi:hypothetical protein
LNFTVPRFGCTIFVHPRHVESDYMPISRQKEERMWALTEKFGKSGDYIGWWDIEPKLRSLGYPRARALLDNEGVRARLDRICNEARKSRMSRIKGGVPNQ